MYINGFAPKKTKEKEEIRDTYIIWILWLKEQQFTEVQSEKGFHENLSIEDLRVLL